MCHSDALDDTWAAVEMIAHMENRDSRYLDYQPCLSIEDITGMISQHEIVVTQRFHGIVLSEMIRIPYISIYHHDKLKLAQPGEGCFLSYYNSSKQSYIDAFVRTSKMNFVSSLPIESTIFETFAKEVASLI
jgi:hypothetical protein